MIDNLTFGQRCALRLFRLCASPNKTLHHQHISGWSDKDGVIYGTHIKDLIELGFLKRHHMTIEILELGSENDIGN